MSAVLPQQQIMEKILSIIVPSYNSEKFLDKCISSFLNEKVLDSLDIIIVNDGSTDGTVSKAEEYCGRYPGSVRLISQKNKGHGGALNTGLAAAKGKYSKVVDADDWVVTENLPEYIESLKSAEADVVLTHHYTIDVSNGEKKSWKSYPEKFGRTYSFSDIMSSWKSFDRSLTFHGITYKTEFYKKNCIQLSEHVFYEDHEYATIPCCKAKMVLPLDMFVYCYRIGDVAQSVSDENQLKRLSHTETVLKRLIDESEKIKLDDDQKKYYCMKAQGLLLSYIMTTLLVDKDRKRGRKNAEKMMLLFKDRLPETYILAEKQYKVFRLFNSLHINKAGWERISGSLLYNKIRGNHSFE